MIRPTAPVAPQHPHTWERITGPSVDPWAWLRSKDHPDTIPYLLAENEWADAWFDEHADTVETIFGEIKGRVQETDLSVPSRRDDWWYVSRTEEGKSYPIFCRGRSLDTAADSVILDCNVEAEGLDYFEAGAFDVSPDHTLLAWSIDADGSEQYEMRFRRLGEHGWEPLADTIADTYYGTAWSADNDWLFYVRPDEQMRPFQVWRHRLGTPSADDVLVFEEPDERFFVTLDLSRSNEWIVIDASCKTMSEVRLLRADDPTGALVVVRERTEGVEYGVEPWDDAIVITTNEDAEDFRVMTAPFDRPGDWTELVPHESGRRITQVEAFRSFLIVHEWSAAQPRLRIVRADGSSQLIELTDEPHDVDLGANPDYSTTVVRFSYQSLTAPASVWDLDVVSGVRTLLKETPVPNVDLSQYVSSRIWTASHDGTQVPVDIVHRRDTPLDGSAPACLYGYGSYESSMPPWFSVARLSLLDRGWVWALGHPRGGGEMGRRWYLDGRLEHKRNTFLDFIASARALADSAIADPDRIAIRGGSAGGLLVGASVTIAPDAFAAVVAEVPFVDVVSTMLDASLPLTVTEWEEWGDPAVEPFASYMLSYSPYDNVAAHTYPPMLVTAGLNDPRVSYHEPAKWVAKLRAVADVRPPLLFKTEMGAGHGGPSGRYDSWREEARVLTFLVAAV